MLAFHQVEHQQVAHQSQGTHHGIHQGDDNSQHVGAVSLHPIGSLQVEVLEELQEGHVALVTHLAVLQQTQRCVPGFLIRSLFHASGCRAGAALAELIHPMLGGEAEAPLPPAPVREPSEHDGQRLCRSVGRCGGYAYIRPRGAGACAAAAAELSRVLSAAAAPPYQPLLLSVPILARQRWSHGSSSCFLGSSFRSAVPR